MRTELSRLIAVIMSALLGAGVDGANTPAIPDAAAASHHYSSGSLGEWRGLTGPKRVSAVAFTGKPGMAPRMEAVSDVDWLAQRAIDGWTHNPILLLGHTTGTPSQPDAAQFTFAAITSDHIEGTANIHGIATDHSRDAPPLDPDDWEILNDNQPIVHHSETIGERKIDPVGFYLSDNNLSLFYNSGWDSWDDWERGTSTNQAGSLYAFSDDFSVKQDYHDNPVLNEPQRKWQGRNRTNPYALVWHPKDEYFYCYYGDFAEGADNDLYPGRRALGVARSKDLKEWEYITTDAPLFHILDMKDFKPAYFSDIDDVTRQGRVYAFGAIYHDGYIYLNVGGSTNRELDYSFIIRSKHPVEGWEFVRINNHRPMPIYYDGRWYTPRNIVDPDNPDKRAMSIVVYDDFLDPNDTGTRHYIFSTGHPSSAGASRQLFMYQGRWHIAYRQGRTYRQMYIAREKR